MNYIYEYVNKINGKKYIGQTNNIERRKREHKSAAFNKSSTMFNSLFQIKIREYGYENFDFNILEIIELKDRNFINNREIYWIEKNSSFVGDGKGYNLTIGGDANMIESFYSKEDIDIVYKLLFDNKDYSTIEAKTGISKSLISNINNGNRYKRNYKYPIQRHRIEDKVYECLIYDLLNTDLSFANLSKKYNLAVSTVKKMNYGTLNKDVHKEYPIRKINGVTQRANSVKELLELNHTNKEIINIVGVSNETVRRINKGITHFDNNINYPIRNL